MRTTLDSVSTARNCSILDKRRPYQQHVKRPLPLLAKRKGIPRRDAANDTESTSAAAAGPPYTLPDLPDSIITLILSLLEEPADIVHARLVCKELCRAAAAAVEGIIAADGILPPTALAVFPKAKGIRVCESVSTRPDSCWRTRMEAGIKTLRNAITLIDHLPLQITELSFSDGSIDDMFLPSGMLTSQLASTISSSARHLTSLSVELVDVERCEALPALLADLAACPQLEKLHLQLVLIWLTAHGGSQMFDEETVSFFSNSSVHECDTWDVGKLRSIHNRLQLQKDIARQQSAVPRALDAAALAALAAGPAAGSLRVVHISGAAGGLRYSLLEAKPLLARLVALERLELEMQGPRKAEELAPTIGSVLGRHGYAVARVVQVCGSKRWQVQLQRGGRSVTLASL